MAKLDVGPKGALVHFHNDSFPDLAGLLAYVERLKGTARLRPDSKLVITRAWPDAGAAAQRRAAAVEGPCADPGLSPPPWKGGAGGWADERSETFADSVSANRIGTVT